MTKEPAEDEAIADTVLALERGALDRWSKGDPHGYLDLYAQEIRYFDPFAAMRIDGLRAMQELLLPVAGTFSIDRYEMLNPSVNVDGDTVLLTYNLVNYMRGADNAELVGSNWNCTEVYQRQDGRVEDCPFSLVIDQTCPSESYISTPSSLRIYLCHKWE